MKHCNNKSKRFDENGDDTEDDYSSKKDVNETATVTVADLVTVSPSPHETNLPTTNSYTTISNDNEDKNGDADVEKILLEKLTSDQGLLFRQFLSLREKEYQHQLQLQLIKEKVHELTMEQKNHELMLERKNAEISKQQYELELFKLRYTLETEKQVDCTAFEAKMLEVQSKIDVMGDTMKNQMERLEQRMVTIETRLRHEIKSLTKIVLPKYLAFENNRYSWKTFVASSWPAMIVGKHKWTVKYSSLDLGGKFDSCVGLISVKDHLQYEQDYDNNSFIGLDIPGWGYAHGGKLYHAGQKQKIGLQHFYPDSKLYFVLDLGSETQNNVAGNTNIGNLYVSINDGEPYLLYSNLSRIARSNCGFFPAISLAAASVIFYEYDYECVMDK